MITVPRLFSSLIQKGIDKESLRRSIASFRNKNWRLQNLYKIKSKQKQTIQFKPNYAQRVIEEKIREAIDAGKPLRFIILKSRQIGCTTYFIIRNFDQVYWNRNQFAAVIAHKREKAEEIFSEIVKFVYSELHPAIKFRAQYDSVRQISWDKTHSQIKVTSEGHGITPNLLHLSEVARMQNPKDMVVEALQGVPFETGMAVMESTANGRCGFFYDMWQESAADPDAIWIPIFIKWWLQDDCRLPVPRGFKLADAEQKLLEYFGCEGLTLENIVFRRHKITEGGKKEDEETGLTGELLFQQNYPMTPQEAFVVPRGCFFNVAALHDMELHKPDPLKIEQIRRGYLKVFKEKQENRAYLISCDTAYGAAKDYTAATVFDRKTREIMATFRGKYSSIDFARYLLRLGEFYNNALLAVERNAGHAVLNELINHSNYTNIYYHLEYDEFRRKIRKPGFPTTPKTRNVMLSRLEDSIARREFEIPDPTFIAECLSFGYSEKGKLEAMNGNDDCVISLAIGDYLCAEATDLNVPAGGIKCPVGI